jgi:hypothetical protein
MVDARDLKSLGMFSREGSSPSVRTNKIKYFSKKGTNAFGLQQPMVNNRSTNQNAPAAISRALGGAISCLLGYWGIRHG